MGVPPLRIDILTRIDGVEFEAAWDDRFLGRFGRTEAPVLSRRHLLANKKAAGQMQDMADVEWLERNPPREDG